MYYLLCIAVYAPYAVVPLHRSLTPVFESEKLSQDLRSLIRRTFPSFCSPGEGTVEAALYSTTQSGGFFHLPCASTCLPCRGH